MARDTINTIPPVLKRVLYAVLNSFFSILFFFILYRIFMKSTRVYWKIWIMLSFTGIAGSWVARFVLRFYDNTLKPLQGYIQNIIIPLLYALLIWVGLIEGLFLLVEQNNITYLQFYGLFLMIKLFIFFAADWFADLLTFQSI